MENKASVPSFHPNRKRLRRCREPASWHSRQLTNTLHLSVAARLAAGVGLRQLSSRLFGAAMPSHQWDRPGSHAVSVNIITHFVKFENVIYQ